MAKHDKDSENRTKTSQHCFRLSEDDALRFEKFAKHDGYSTIAAWAAALVRLRSDLLETHVREGTYAYVRDLIVPYTEIPGLDPNECRLANAEQLARFVDDRGDHVDLSKAIPWLAEVQLRGTQSQKERAFLIARSMGDDFVFQLQEATR